VPGGVPQHWNSGVCAIGLLENFLAQFHFHYLEISYTIHGHGSGVSSLQ